MCTNKTNLLNRSRSIFNQTKKKVFQKEENFQKVYELDTLRVEAVTIMRILVSYLKTDQRYLKYPGDGYKSLSIT